MRIATQHGTKISKYHSPERSKPLPHSGKSRLPVPNNASSRGIVIRECNRGRQNKKACLNRWSGSAPTVKKRRAGGVLRVSTSKRETVVAIWSMVASKEDDII